MRLFRPHARLKAVLALAGALMLLTQSAEASHDLQFSVSQSSYATNAYANITSFTYFGSNEPSNLTLQLPTGYKVAHADSTTSPITPVPNNGDDVGTGTAHARWWPFCTEGDKTLDLTWDSTPSGGPSGTVGQVTVTASGGLFTSQAYIVQQGTNDYDIVVSSFPNSVICDSTTNGSTSLTVTGTVSGSNPARRVVQNPSSTGTYTWNVSYTDTSSGAHSDSTTTSIT